MNQSPQHLGMCRHQIVEGSAVETEQMRVCEGRGQGRMRLWVQGGQLTKKSYDHPAVTPSAAEAMYTLGIIKRLFERIVKQRRRLFAYATASPGTAGRSALRTFSRALSALAFEPRAARSCIMRTPS